MMDSETVVPGIMLLGVVVDATVVVNLAEHQRRAAAGVGAVDDPILLNQLLNLPYGLPVDDPVTWAVMTGQPPGIARCSTAGHDVTRLLQSPATITSVIINARKGREFKAVQDASWFGGFYLRWIRLAPGNRKLPDTPRLEATLCGVGILDHAGNVILPAQEPCRVRVDRWSWMHEEKVYGRWLKLPPRPLPGSPFRTREPARPDQSLEGPAHTAPGQDDQGQGR